MDMQLSEFQMMMSFPGMIHTLAIWNVHTLRDLSRCGIVSGLPDRPDAGLLDLKGVGPKRINWIRTFLARHGLELVDEQEYGNALWLKDS